MNVGEHPKPPKLAPWAMWSIIAGLLALAWASSTLAAGIWHDGRAFYLAPTCLPLAACAIAGARAARRIIAGQPGRYAGRRLGIAGEAMGWVATGLCAAGAVVLLLALMTHWLH